MALTKVLASMMEYTPVNKAGDTLTGQLRVNKAGNNTTTLTPSAALAMAGRISSDGVTNTQGYIFDGISMGGSGEEYAGIYAYDDGGSAATGVVLFGGTTSAIAKGVDVDSLGRVKMPNQPAFSAKLSPATSATNTLKFATVQQNIGSGYNSSTGRFTAPVAGSYYFHCHCLFNSGAANLSLKKNSTDYVIMETDESGFHQAVISAVVPLAAGDYVEIVVYMGSVYGNYDNFSGYLIG